MRFSSTLFRVLLFFSMLCLCFASCKTGKKTSASTKKKQTKNTKTVSVENHKEKLLKEKYAAALGVNAADIKNIKLYAFVDEWMGVPYKYGGKDKNGIDCSSFTSTLYQQVYNKNVNGPTSSLIDLTNVISPSDLKEGDMVFFHIEKKGTVSHVGVYLQNNKFVHATTKKGVMINDLSENYYKQHFFKAGKLK
jgi:murein DD-endopeptidase / murein LD-carboxypeptidase